MRWRAIEYETRGKVALSRWTKPHMLNALSAAIRGVLEGLSKADADIRVAEGGRYHWRWRQFLLRRRRA